MDMDGSRRISFNELDVLVRHQLGLKEKHLSQTQLLALWKKLDENASGFIDAGELSRFLRIGQSNELTPAQRARKKLQQARLAEKERLREESRKRLERNVADKSQTVEKATEEEMARFAKIFNEKLKGSDITNFFALFKWMDMDGSGKVKFDEFDSMVRKALKVAHSEVSNANLFSLWAAIDENQNGFISSGEFVHFMRSASAQIDESERLDRNVAAESTQRLAEQATLAQIGKEETWARVRATQAVQKAKAMEAEIERIERLMADFEALRKKSDKLHAKVSSGKQSRFQTPGHLPEVGAVPQEEEPPADAGDDASVPSPGGQSTMTSTLGSTNGKRKERVTASSIRAEALHMLAREVNMPGMLPKRSPSMLLPTLQREEGGL
jgi:Ca2+-binding EF-hand superfamily protein